jgi:hypothetical protein
MASNPIVSPVVPAARRAPERPWRIGVTGHSNLTRASEGMVAHALRSALTGRVDDARWVGVSCLAPGADRAFARVVLQLGGTLEVVLPARDYRDGHVDPEDLAEFDRLLASAQMVCTLAFDCACRRAYVAASDTMLTAVDEVLAVWDGEPAVAQGSTAEVVAEAHHRRLPVTVIWPSGCARTARAGEARVSPSTV